MKQMLDLYSDYLLASFSQLNVKARSSVFRYKGKDTNAQTIGKELNVQAILNGRVVQRGQDLILYVELVDAATENSLWKQTYDKTMTNLVALQNDIAEISNIPMVGIKRRAGIRIGSVTRCTKPRKVLRVKTNHDEMKRIKINKI